MPKRVYIETQGCQMNVYDSGKMLEILEGSLGYLPAEKPEDAGLLVLNTCSVREKAFDKALSRLGRWRLLKRERPTLRIAVGGCVASQEGAELLARAPFIDVVFGPQTLQRLPALLNAREATGRAQVDVRFPAIEKFDSLPEPKVTGPAAFVSIMEGCSKYCSFCIVPYTRGEEVNRPFADVIAEVYTLAEKGVREITFLGQNVNAWRAPHRGRMLDLAELIRYAASIEGIERIRFTTSHPIEFGERLIEVFAEVPKLAGHLHLPIQSGSDRILARMKRGYTTLEYRSKVRRLRAARPGLSLTTDLIVGFPGETDADFESTIDLVREVGFDQSFLFTYSPRPGTPAANIPDPVPDSVKSERLARLKALIDAKALELSRAAVGSTLSVLVERVTDPDGGMLSGRTETNHWMHFRGPAHLWGRMVPVVVTEGLANSLRGHLAEPAKDFSEHERARTQVA
ncbi:MAG: tRNA (N6-isopentenyl adenosine(37)-C2)-methylthiotransferase MiaB [Gammaproteobacteria bacterium]